jgi:hypothetical protein
MTEGIPPADEVAITALEEADQNAGPNDRLALRRAVLFLLTGEYGEENGRRDGAQVRLGSLGPEDKRAVLDNVLWRRAALCCDPGLRELGACGWYTGTVRIMGGARDMSVMRASETPESRWFMLNRFT